MIYYFCPDHTNKSAGVRILYRHVQVLEKHGYAAAIMHNQPGFVLPDVPNVTVRYCGAPINIDKSDIAVIPEGLPIVMRDWKAIPIRRFAIALNWKYVYEMLPNDEDWRTYGVERILTHSAFIGDYLTWAMGLPSHTFRWGIKPELYYYEPREKQGVVVFLLRKKYAIRELIRVLYSRNPAFFDRIKWSALNDLSEEDYARNIRQASVFVNMSEAEGLPCSLLEAMKAGTLVAGYNSVGGQRELIGSGARQNCILAENLDYPNLARNLEPLLTDILSGDLSRWEGMRRNALATAEEYSLEAEEQSILEMWRGILGR